jgi:hypothetical protein
MSSYRSTLAVLALIVMAAGCATKVETAATDPDFAAGLAAHPRVALGGVVAADLLQRQLAPADREDADLAMYRAFLGSRPDLTVWPPEAVDGRLAPGQIDSLRAEYAIHGRLRPERVVALSDPLDGARYLMLARITADQIRSIVPTPETNPSHVAGDQERSGEHWDSGVSTERRVTIELHVYDLESGTLAWQADAQSRARQLYAYEDQLATDGTYVRDRLADADQAPTLSRDGEFLQTPDLIDLLEEALSETVQRLPRVSP